ncbi:MAG TPA: hypothetical protein PKD17_08935 [Cellvibrionaceae bacterium]|nr:hypothetical protein [Cellvibrionaceae bacterium]HMW71931.1 hypothetical protein [Cellvibrionaceae bacterium]HNG59119.1 hypothetical protein [Cellvibrionaceae bacterium]
MGGSKQYVKEFAWVMGTYGLLLPLCLWRIYNGASGIGKYAWAILPTLPLLALIAVIAREIARMDEFMQRVHVLSFGITLAITGAVTTLWGFLEIAGLPPISIIYVFPFSVSTWGIINCLMFRHYASVNADAQ